MPAWNETHYARAQEFTRLLSAALADATPVTPSPALASVPPTFPASTPPPAPNPTPTPTPEPLPAASTAAPVAAPTTGANLFKKIPWKK